jgi:hypothetical protein
MRDAIRITGVLIIEMDSNNTMLAMPITVDFAINESQVEVGRK